MYKYYIIVGEPGVGSRDFLLGDGARAVKTYLVGAGKNPPGAVNQAFFRGSRSRELVKKGTGSPTLIICNVYC